MKQVGLIFLAEWQYWARSRLALIGLLVSLSLLVLSAWINATRIEQAATLRSAQQTAAEQRFLNQPARHPHRMVHYGHYVFRTPMPLATFDPGVDTVTGQSLFLEGHRQNADMFADGKSAPNTGGFDRFDPAQVYQLLLPLLLIALGYASMVRERESQTLTTLLCLGVSGRQLFLGKWLALLSVVLPLSLPQLWLIVAAVDRGESLTIAFSMVGLYATYFVLWTLLIMLVSLNAQQQRTALTTLVLAWILLSLLVPRLAVAIAEGGPRSAGKIHTDLAMQAALRAKGDGHNANDPAFAALRDGLLAKYHVDRVEDLPVNFRGVVALHAEKQLTEVLNDHAKARMQQEQSQVQTLRDLAWFSPTLATALASRRLAGTDIENHHRFLTEAEALRFEFVQGLNKAHAKRLRYDDDQRRSVDAAAEKRTRIDPSHWQLLRRFEFAPAPTSHRIRAAKTDVLPVLVWIVGLFGLCYVTAGRLRP